MNRKDIITECNKINQMLLNDVENGLKVYHIYDIKLIINK